MRGMSSSLIAVCDVMAGVFRREEQGHCEGALGPDASSWMSVERSHSEPCHSLQSQYEADAVDVRRASSDRIGELVLRSGGLSDEGFQR